MKYTFGRISVDASARTIAVAAEPVHLTRKAFDLLLLLLEHRGSAVSKDSIYARLWPETFVAESSLQTLVHEIRQAIDDRANEHVLDPHGSRHRLQLRGRRARHAGGIRIGSLPTARRMVVSRIDAPAPAMWEKTSSVVEWRT